MKKTKVVFKFKGKKHAVLTNKYGKATFKIKNYENKGTHKLTVIYNGSKYYYKITKSVKIRIIG
jgi:hypothetical protein